MSEIQGSGGIRPQSESHEVQERGEQENVPETLRNARVGQQLLDQYVLPLRKRPPHPALIMSKDKRIR